MIFAPVLQEIAARISGSSPESMLSSPAKWAYAVRDACELARPDWIVSHFDPRLESTALRDAAGDLEEAEDVALAGLPGPEAVATLVATLAELHPAGTVAASLTGPATIAADLCERFAVADAERRLDLLDACADGVAELGARLAERGAGRLLVWEPGVGGFDPDDVVSAHAPLLRRAATIGCEAVLCADEESGSGFELVATPEGDRARLLPAARIRDALSFEEVFRPLQRAGLEIVITDGPIPADCDLRLIREAGEREERTSNLERA